MENLPFPLLSFSLIVVVAAVFCSNELKWIFIDFFHVFDVAIILWYLAAAGAVAVLFLFFTLFSLFRSLSLSLAFFLSLSD